MSDLTPTSSPSGPARTDFSAINIPQWGALGLMAAAVGILGLWFMSWSTAPSWDIAASGLTAAEAADITSELESQGITYRLANGGTSVEVPTSDGPEARVALGDLATISGTSQGYELLDEQGFLSSSFRQRIDYQRAVEGELARTILSMESITSAVVHLAIPEDRLFTEHQELTQASVVVGGTVNQSTVASIVNIVASSVPGLDPSNVTVAETSGRILSSGNGESGFSGDHLEIQSAFEAQLEMAATSMLSSALGDGRVVVRVTADLDFDESESETVTYVTEDSVTLRQQTLDEAYTGDNSVALGTLGTAELVTDAGDLAGDSGSAYLRQEENSEFGVPSTRTVSRQSPGSVQRITVAVLVDETIEPAPDIDQLALLVAAAVGADDERGDSVVVQTMAFGTEDAVAAEEAAAAAEAALDAEAGGDGLEPIIAYAKTGAAVVAMLLALVFLRKGLKELIAPTVREPIEISDATLGELASGASEATTITPRVIGADTPTGSTADSSTTVDMLDLIDSQSDEVAHLLRDLVSQASS